MLTIHKSQHIQGNSVVTSVVIPRIANYFYQTVPFTFQEYHYSNDQEDLIK